MQIFGVLIFDEKYELSASELIKVAAREFVDESGKKPVLALVNATIETIPAIEGLKVVTSYWLRPHQAIVGVLINDEMSAMSNQPRAKKTANPNVQ